MIHNFIFLCIPVWFITSILNSFYYKIIACIMYLKAVYSDFIFIFHQLMMGPWFCFSRVPISGIMDPPSPLVVDGHRTSSHGDYVLHQVQDK
jgi:hypothetical protein